MMRLSKHEGQSVKNVGRLEQEEWLTIKLEEVRQNQVSREFIYGSQTYLWHSR
jgi:hypothetical protein